MANPEHVKILKQGVEIWNKWRVMKPEVEPSLKNADLRGLKLVQANFMKTNMNNTNLNNVNLKRANFEGASLKCASLIQAQIEDANFKDADLERINFLRANIADSNLSGANLSHATLEDTNFVGASIKNAVLSGANLTRAILENTNSEGAVFEKANLNRTNIRNADLDKTNFKAASLWMAIIENVNVSGASFKEAKIAHCSFNGVDLSEAKDVESIVHGAPSHIGLDTIYKSKGKIPEAFLRGCGVPMKFIIEIPNLLEGDGQPKSCFISYSHADEEFVDQLQGDLRKNDINCWYAPKDIKSGQKIYKQLEEAIGQHDRLLLVLSDASMESPWVKSEIAKARKLKRDLHPISIVPFEKIRNWKQFDADVGGDTAKELREYYIPDFSGWQDSGEYKKALEKLIEDLKSES